MSTDGTKKGLGPRVKKGYLQRALQDSSRVQNVQTRQLKFEGDLRAVGRPLITSDKSKTSRPLHVSYLKAMLVSSENDTMLATSKGGVRAVLLVTSRLFAKTGHA